MMFGKFSSVPTPVAGLALALISLAVLVDQQLALQGIFQLIVAAPVVCLLLAVVLKFVFQPVLFLAELKHPVAGALLPVITMAIIVLSQVFANFSPAMVNILLSLALCIQLLLLASFIYIRAGNLALAQFVPPWFIPPIGLVLYVVVAPTSLSPIWQGVFLFGGLIAYGLLLPVIGLRLLRFPLAAEIKPVLAILATPASLILLGFLKSDLVLQKWFVVGLFSIALAMTFFIYAHLYRLLRLPFSPASSALTFPLVVSATLIFQMVDYGVAHDFAEIFRLVLSLLAWFELVVAFIVVCWVSGRFIRFAFKRAL